MQIIKDTQNNLDEHHKCLSLFWRVQMQVEDSPFSICPNKNIISAAYHYRPTTSSYLETNEDFASSLTSLSPYQRNTFVSSFQSTWQTVMLLLGSKCIFVNKMPHWNHQIGWHILRFHFCVSKCNLFIPFPWNIFQLYVMVELLKMVKDWLQKHAPYYLGICLRYFSDVQMLHLIGN